MEPYHKQYYKENKKSLDEYSIDYYNANKKQIRNKRLERNPMCCCGSRKEAHNKTDTFTFVSGKKTYKNMCKTHYLFKATLMSIAKQMQRGRPLKVALCLIVPNMPDHLRQKCSQLSLKKLQPMRPHKL